MKIKSFLLSLVLIITAVVCGISISQSNTPIIAQAAVAEFTDKKQSDVDALEYHFKVTYDEANSLLPYSLASKHKDDANYITEGYDSAEAVVEAIDGKRYVSSLGKYYNCEVNFDGYVKDDFTFSNGTYFITGTLGTGTFVDASKKIYYTNPSTGTSTRMYGGNVPSGYFYATSGAKLVFFGGEFSLKGISATSSHIVSVGATLSLNSDTYLIEKQYGFDEVWVNIENNNSNELIIDSSSTFQALAKLRDDDTVEKKTTIERCDFLNPDMYWYEDLGANYLINLDIKGDSILKQTNLQHCETLFYATTQTTTDFSFCNVNFAYDIVTLNSVTFTGDDSRVLDIKTSTTATDCTFDARMQFNLYSNLSFKGEIQWKNLSVDDEEFVPTILFGNVGWSCIDFRNSDYNYFVDYQGIAISTEIHLKGASNGDVLLKGVNTLDNFVFVDEDELIVDGSPVSGVVVSGENIIYDAFKYKITLIDNKHSKTEELYVDKGDVISGYDTNGLDLTPVEGYEFNGWSLNGTVYTLSEYEHNAEATFYASWSIIKYQLNFAGLEGANVKESYDDIITVSDVGSTLVLPKAGQLENLPEKKDLIGWSRNFADGEIIQSITITLDNYDSMGTFYAHYKAYNVVTFEDEILSTSYTEKVYEGEKVVEPEDPTTDHYDFKYWKYLGAEFNFDTIITTDITLTAVWEIHKYTITFVNASDFEGVTNWPTEIVLDYNTVPTQPANPVLEGYGFVAWKTALGGEFNWALGLSANVELYAEFSPTIYYIIFDFSDTIASSARVSNIEITIENVGEYILLPSKLGIIDLPENVEFIGWLTQKNDETTLISDTYLNELAQNRVTITADNYEGFTLYALVKTIYTLTFKNEDGTTFRITTAPAGYCFVDPLDYPIKTGYNFRWWRNDTDDNQFDFGIPAYKDMVAIPEYTIIRLTITIDTTYFENVSTVPAYRNGEVTVDYGSVPAMPGYNPVRTGYRFVRWYRIVGDEQVTFLWSGVVTESFTIYALWEENLYTIDYVLLLPNNESLTYTITDEATYGQIGISRVGEFTLPSQSDLEIVDKPNRYNIIGWLDESDYNSVVGGATIESYLNYTVTLDNYTELKFYAVWAEATLKVVFNLTVGEDSILPSSSFDAFDGFDIVQDKAIFELTSSSSALAVPDVYKLNISSDTNNIVSHWYYGEEFTQASIINYADFVELAEETADGLQMVITPMFDIFYLDLYSGHYNSDSNIEWNNGVAIVLQIGGRNVAVSGKLIIFDKYNGEYSFAYANDITITYGTPYRSSFQLPEVRIGQHEILYILYCGYLPEKSNYTLEELESGYKGEVSRTLTVNKVKIEVECDSSSEAKEADFTGEPQTFFEDTDLYTFENVTQTDGLPYYSSPYVGYAVLRQPQLYEWRSAGYSERMPVYYRINNIYLERIGYGVVGAFNWSPVAENKVVQVHINDLFTTPTGFDDDWYELTEIQINSSIGTYANGVFTIPVNTNIANTQGISFTFLKNFKDTRNQDYCYVNIIDAEIIFDNDLVFKCQYGYLEVEDLNLRYANNDGGYNPLPEEYYEYFEFTKYNYVNFSLSLRTIGSQQAKLVLYNRDLAFYISSPQVRWTVETKKIVSPNEYFKDITIPTEFDYCLEEGDWGVFSWFERYFNELFEDYLLEYNDIELLIQAGEEWNGDYITSCRPSQVAFYCYDMQSGTAEWTHRNTIGPFVIESDYFGYGDAYVLNFNINPIDFDVNVTATVVDGVPNIAFDIEKPLEWREEWEDEYNTDSKIVDRIYYSLSENGEYTLAIPTLSGGENTVYYKVIRTRTQNTGEGIEYVLVKDYKEQTGSFKLTMPKTSNNNGGGSGSNGALIGIIAGVAVLGLGGTVTTVVVIKKKKKVK